MGRGLAYLELCLAVGRVLWVYDIKRAEGTEDVTVRRARGVKEVDREGLAWVVRDDEFQLKDRFLADKNGPMVKFRRWNGVKGNRIVERLGHAF